MLDEGLLVTISSDDPAYFGGYVDDNFAAIEREMGLTPVELATLAANSFEASFISDEQRAGYLAEVVEALTVEESLASTRALGE
jgi:adenosine deaminase